MITLNEMLTETQINCAKNKKKIRVSNDFLEKNKSKSRNLRQTELESRCRKTNFHEYRRRRSGDKQKRQGKCEVIFETCTSFWVASSLLWLLSAAFLTM